MGQASERRMTRTRRREMKDGWSTFAELANSPYTIVTGRGAAAKVTCGDFAGDEEALRWAHYYLGHDRANVARLYRGHIRARSPRGRPIAVIEAPEG